MSKKIAIPRAYTANDPKLAAFGFFAGRVHYGGHKVKWDPGQRRITGVSATGGVLSFVLPAEIVAELFGDEPKTYLMHSVYAEEKNVWTLEERSGIELTIPHTEDLLDPDLIRINYSYSMRDIRESIRWYLEYTVKATDLDPLEAFRFENMFVYSNCVLFQDNLDEYLIVPRHDPAFKYCLTTTNTIVLKCSEEEKMNANEQKT